MPPYYIWHMFYPHHLLSGKNKLLIPAVIFFGSLLLIFACSKEEFTYKAPPDVNIRSDWQIESYFPMIVRFSNTTSVSEPGAILKFHWNFGDGSASTEKAPVHIYNITSPYIALMNICAEDYSASLGSVTSVIDNMVLGYPDLNIFSGQDVDMAAIIAPTEYSTAGFTFSFNASDTIPTPVFSFAPIIMAIPDSILFIEVESIAFEYIPEISMNSTDSNLYQGASVYSLWFGYWTKPPMQEFRHHQIRMFHQFMNDSLMSVRVVNN